MLCSYGGYKDRSEYARLNYEGFYTMVLEKDDILLCVASLRYHLIFACLTLDTQVEELEMEIDPVLDELAKSISILNLERGRRFKGHLLALTLRVQKACDEIEQLMNDDGDMAEMIRVCPRIRSTSGTHKLQRAFSNDKRGSLVSSSVTGETDNIDQLEMLLEAYFVGIDNTLNKLLSLMEYIDDTEDLINIKLGFSDSNDSVNLQTMRFKDRTVDNYQLNAAKSGSQNVTPAKRVMWSGVVEVETWCQRRGPWKGYEVH
ncbi:magnesium transporter MRS2-5 [Tanacetum coccineum]